MPRHDDRQGVNRIWYHLWRPLRPAARAQPSACPDLKDGVSLLALLGLILVSWVVMVEMEAREGGWNGQTPPSSGLQADTEISDSELHSSPTNGLVAEHFGLLQRSNADGKCSRLRRTVEPRWQGKFHMILKNLE